MVWGRVCQPPEVGEPDKVLNGNLSGDFGLVPAMGQIDWDLDIAVAVRESGKPNVYGLQIPVASNWNFSLLESLASSASDREVIAFLQYGWPLNRELDVPLTITLHNHEGANRHGHEVEDYLRKELHMGTLIDSHLFTLYLTYLH